MTLVMYHTSHSNSLSRSGLTPGKGPAREDRMLPVTGTLNGSSSWKDDTKLRISMQ